MSAVEDIVDACSIDKYLIYGTVDGGRGCHLVSLRGTVLSLGGAILRLSVDDR